MQLEFNLTDRFVDDFTISLYLSSYGSGRSRACDRDAEGEHEKDISAQGWFVHSVEVRILTYLLSDTYRVFTVKRKGR